jgi:uncharacterized protein with PQ loop repeat
LFALILPQLINLNSSEVLYSILEEIMRGGHFANPGKFVAMLVGLLLFLVSAYLFQISAKRIQAKKRAYKWSIIAFLLSIFLFHIGPSDLVLLGSVLGVVGAISGMMSAKE